LPRLFFTFVLISRVREYLQNTIQLGESPHLWQGVSPLPYYVGFFGPCFLSSPEQEGLDGPFLLSICFTHHSCGVNPHLQSHSSKHCTRPTSSSVNNTSSVWSSSK